MKKIAMFLLMFAFISVNALEDIVPNVKSAILIEESTGKILYEKKSRDYYNRV